MSGSELITTASHRGYHAAFISLRIIWLSSSSFGSVLAQDVLYRTDRVRQGRLHRF